MDRENESDELILLGIASAETRGAMITTDDEEGGYKPHAGLSDE